MTRPSRPEVSDRELRDALDLVGSHIENYNSNLDAISKDIKAIEGYLTDSGVRVNEYVRIGYTEEFTDGDYDAGRNYAGGIQRDVENIEWGPVDGDGSRWRLMYCKFRRFGQIDICEGVALAGPTYAGASQYLESKPLIETSVAIRLRAHQQLPKLLEKIAKAVEVRPMVLPISDDDIPL